MAPLSQKLKAKNPFVIVLVIFLAALLLRVLYVFTLDNIHIGLWDDEGWEIAKNLSEGRGYSMSYHINGLLSFRPPVFPLFLYSIFVVFGQNLLIVRIFLALFGAAIPLVIFFLGKKIFNFKAGVIAMIISAFYPVFVYWSGYIGPETLAVLCLVLAILFLIQTENSPIYYAILTGICIGIFSLTRSVGHGLLPLFLMWLAVTSKKKKQALLAGGIILVTFGLVVSPWVIRNYKVHHRFVLASSEGGITFYSANNPDVLTKGRGDFYVPDGIAQEAMNFSEVDGDRYFYKKGLDFVRAHPQVYFRLVFERIVSFWRPYPNITGAQDSYGPIHVALMLLTDTPIIFLGLWGLFLLYRKEKKYALLVMLIFFYFTMTSALIRSCVRYRALIMPYLIILVSYWVYSLYKRIKTCD